MNEPYLVVFFGILGYEILSEHPTEEEAEAELEKWQAKARAAEPLVMKGWTRDAQKHDFQVRQQSDLDALTRAIFSTY